jgi:Skp family chaperone for outer membrane proteins
MERTAMQPHQFKTTGGSAMRLLFSLVFLGLLVALTACKRLDEAPLPKVGAGEAKQEPKAVVAGVAAAAKTERDDFVAAMDKELDELKAKIAELKAEATKASGKTKAALEQQIAALDEEAKSAEKKLADVKSATVEKWKDMQAGTKETLDHLKQSVQKVLK